MAKFNPPHVAYDKMQEALSRLRYTRENLEYAQKNERDTEELMRMLAQCEANYTEALRNWERAQEAVRGTDWYKAMHEDTRD